MTGERRGMSDSELKSLFKTGLILSGGALVFMGAFFLLVQQDLIKLHPRGMDSEELRSFEQRLQYTMRYQFLHALWLAFNIIATIHARLSNRAVNPLDGSVEDAVQPMKNILTNSLESFVVSAAAQFAFISYATPLIVLKYIPLINIIQFIGRIAFMIGYPLKRAFGYQCTFVPILVMIVYNIHGFGSFLGFY